MVPPLSQEQSKLMDQFVNKDKYLVGRDKIYHLIETKYPESGISRRQVMDWLKGNRTNQIHDQPINKLERKAPAANPNNNIRKLVSGIWIC
jgi:hypothetical protein